LSEGSTSEPLRVLVANDDEKRLATLVPELAQHGYDLIVRELTATTVDRVLRREQPDVVFVGTGAESAATLALVDRLVEAARCPVALALPEPDAQAVQEAAAHGVFAYVAGSDLAEWRSAIEIARRRFSDLRGLQGAMERRAVIERAKGILMERHSIDEDRAYAMLRDHARANNLRVNDLAAAIVATHTLLPKSP
jgi:AmiR/NasT family two-component response regulator